MPLSTESFQQNKVVKLSKQGFHPLCLVILGLSVFSSIIRLNYNVGLSLIGFFFINRNDIPKYVFDINKTRLYFIVVLFSIILDIVWISVWSKGYKDYENSKTLRKLAPTVQFCFVVSIIELILKLPFLIAIGVLIKNNAMDGWTDTNSHYEHKTDNSKEKAWDMSPVSVRLGFKQEEKEKNISNISNIVSQNDKTEKLDNIIDTKDFTKSNIGEETEYLEEDNEQNNNNISDNKLISHSSESVSLG